MDLLLRQTASWRQFAVALVRQISYPNQLILGLSLTQSFR